MAKGGKEGNTENDVKGLLGEAIEGTLNCRRLRCPTLSGISDPQQRRGLLKVLKGDEEKRVEEDGNSKWGGTEKPGIVTQRLNIRGRRRGVVFEQ